MLQLCIHTHIYIEQKIYNSVASLYLIITGLPLILPYLDHIIVVIQFQVPNSSSEQTYNIPYNSSIIRIQDTEFQTEGNSNAYAIVFIGSLGLL